MSEGFPERTDDIQELVTALRVDLADEINWAEDPPEYPQLRDAYIGLCLQAGMLLDHIEAQEAKIERLEQMDEAWGPTQTIGRSEVDAFIASRATHKPTTRLRERAEKAEAVVEELGEILIGHSCGHGCIVSPPRGMATNGACKHARADGEAQKLLRDVVHDIRKALEDEE